MYLFMIGGARADQRTALPSEFWQWQAAEREISVPPCLRDESFSPLVNSYFSIGMSYPVAYLEGIRLFNAGSFWHAHEQWELCWLTAQGMDVLFFKGIIQSAAALEKWRRGSLYGMQLNWAKSRAKIDQLPILYMGLNLVVFRHQMETFVIEQATADHLALPHIVLLDPERM